MLDDHASAEATERFVSLEIMHNDLEVAHNDLEIAENRIKELEAKVKELEGQLYSKWCPSCIKWGMIFHILI